MAKKKSAKRGNGEGSICLESATGRYRAYFINPQGKRIVKRFKTHAEAVEWLTLKKSEIYTGEYIPQSDLTLGEWTVQYLNTYKKGNVKAKTMDDYIHTAGCLHALADVCLQDLTALQVQQFYTTIPYASRTKIQMHRLLKSVITKAHMLGMVSKNIMLAVDAPKSEKHATTVFTKDELSRILHTTQTDEYYCRYYPMILTAVTTGMRIGELIALKVADLHKGYITITGNIIEIRGKSYKSTPKTAAGRRRITISATLQAILQQLCQDKEADAYIFQTKNGTPYSQDNLRKTWKAIQSKAGIEPRSFHTIRHTHATQLIAAGVPIPEVSARLGHTTVSHTLNIYSHAIPNYDNAIGDKLDKIFL